MDTHISKFFGQANSYVEIAKRSTDKLGVSMVYMMHPVTGTGFLLVRFVAKGANKFSHFTVREEGEFSTETGEKFTALRLNKLAIPVVHPGPSPFSFLNYCDKTLIWEVLSDWIYERCKADGFELVEGIELKTVLKDLVSGKYDSTEESKLNLVLNLPTFEEEKKES